MITFLRKNKNSQSFRSSFGSIKSNSLDVLLMIDNKQNKNDIANIFSKKFSNNTYQYVTFTY